MVELEIGGDGSTAMLRLLHLKQDSIPDTLQVIFIQVKGTVFVV